MKLKNQLITDKLRTFYFKNKWSHKEVQSYLVEHYSISVCIRTLKYWKKYLKDPLWQHPKFCKPPTPKRALNEVNIKKIIDFRKKVGWGGLTIKHVFKLSCSESTIRRLIKSKGLSRGSKIENKRLY